MASGLDELNKAVKKHRGDILLTIASLATAENKWKALGRAVKDIAVWKMIGPLGIVLGTFKGLEGAVRAVLRDTGALSAVLTRMSQITGLQKQFTGLLGSVAAAKRRVAELLQFTNGQKLFNLEATGRAARELEILTRGAFAGRQALSILGDSAAQSGNQLEEVASRVGAFHRELREGQPIRATAEAMAGMGVITGTAADQLAKMQENGASTAQVFDALVSELEKSKGALATYTQSVDGVMAAYKKAREELAMKFGEPFREAEINRMKDATTVLTALQGPIATLAEYLSKITSPLENVTVRLGAWLAKLGALGSVVSGAVTVVKTLATGLLALGLAFGVRAIGGFALTVIRVAGASNKAATAVAGLKSAVAGAIGAARQLAAGNTALAVQAAGAGAASLRTAAAMGVASIASKALGLAVRGLIAGTGIGLLVVAMGYLGEKLLGWSDKAAKAAEAQRELAEANKAAESSLAKQIRDITSLDDAQQALLTSTEQLIAAKRKLAELEDRKRRGEDVSPGELEEARRAAAKAQKTNADLQSGIGAGRFGVSKAQAAILQDEARRELALEDATRTEAIERATGADKLLLMESEQQRLAGEAEEGRNLRTERAALEAGERTRRAKPNPFSPALLDAHLRRKAASPIIREEQAIADMRATGADPGKVQERERALAVRRERLEERQAQNEQRAQEMRFAAERERKAQAMRAADLRAERVIASLRDRGYDREQRAAQARIDALYDQEGILLGAGDQQGAAEMGVRIAAAERELRLMKEKAAVERAMDAAHLKVLQFEQDSAVAAARGQFGAADALRQRAISGRDSIERDQSFQQKMDSGAFTHEEAVAAVEAEQRTREADRAARRDVFRAEKIRELRGASLAVSNEDGAAEELAKMRDEDRFRSALHDGLAAGLPAEEAAGYAIGTAQLAIQREVADEQRNGVVDSLQRIGGGGGIAADPVLTVAQRQQALQETMVSLLREIASTKNGPSTSGEPDVPFD